MVQGELQAPVLAGEGALSASKSSHRSTGAFQIMRLHPRAGLCAISTPPVATHAAQRPHFDPRLRQLCPGVRPVQRRHRQCHEPGHQPCGHRPHANQVCGARTAAVGVDGGRHAEPAIPRRRLRCGHREGCASGQPVGGCLGRVLVHLSLKTLPRPPAHTNMLCFDLSYAIP